MGIMSELTTVEDAIRKAESFIDKYYPFHKLESVKKVGNIWIVRYDVSVIGPKVVIIIKLEKQTGDVVEYTSAG